MGDCRGVGAEVEGWLKGMARGGNKDEKGSLCVWIWLGIFDGMCERWRRYMSRIGYHLSSNYLNLQSY